MAKKVQISTSKRDELRIETLRGSGKIKIGLTAGQIRALEGSGLLHSAPATIATPADAHQPTVSA